MKHLLLLALLCAALGLLGCKGMKRNAERAKSLPPPAGRLVGFDYGEQGTMAQPKCAYRLRRGQDGKVSLYASRLFGEEETWGDTVEVRSEVADFVQLKISENNLQNYHDRYEPAVEVMDGESWYYEAVYDDNTSLKSCGFNAWPGDGTLKAIAAYLDSCYLAAKGLPS